MGVLILFIAIIILLVVIIVFLTLYNMSVHRKIETFSNLNQKIVSLNVLQEFMNTKNMILSILQ